MTLNTLELKNIKDAAKLAKFFLQTAKPRIDALNIDYDASGGTKSTIDQAGLDAEPSLSGITKAQLDDALYALTSSLKGVLDSSYSQLEKLASRAENTNTPFGSL